MASVLGNRIKSVRESAGMNQVELARALHIGNTTLSQYETGKRIPSDTIKLLIAQYFNVSLDYLMGLTNIKEPAALLLNPGSSISTTPSLTPHEERLVLAYRAQPALQAAVDKLLDIEEVSTPSQSETA